MDEDQIASGSCKKARMPGLDREEFLNLFELWRERLMVERAEFAPASTNSGWSDTN